MMMPWMDAQPSCVGIRGLYVRLFWLRVFVVLMGGRMRWGRCMRRVESYFHNMFADLGVASTSRRKEGKRSVSQGVGDVRAL